MNLRKDHYRNGLGEATSRGRPELERAFDISSSLLLQVRSLDSEGPRRAVPEGLRWRRVCFATKPLYFFSGYLDQALGARSRPPPHPLSVGARLAPVSGSKSRCSASAPLHPDGRALFPESVADSTPELDNSGRESERTENQRNNFGRWITRLARR